jgi:hypothetical protein
MNCDSWQAGHYGAYARDVNGPTSTDIAYANGMQTSAQMHHAHDHDGDVQHGVGNEEFVPRMIGAQM